MRRSRVVLSALALTAVLAGCAPGGGARDDLSGTSWTAVIIDGSGTIEQARPTIRFAPDGTVGGTTGCNQFSAPYRLDGASIDIGELTSTKVACDEERMAQEGAFLSALGGAETWRRTESGELELTGTNALVLRAG